MFINRYLLPIIYIYIYIYHIIEIYIHHAHEVVRVGTDYSANFFLIFNIIIIIQCLIPKTVKFSSTRFWVDYFSEEYRLLKCSITEELFVSSEKWEIWLAMMVLRQLCVCVFYVWLANNFKHVYVRISYIVEVLKKL